MAVKVEIIPESEVQRPGVQFVGFMAEVHKAMLQVKAGEVLRVTTDTNRKQGIGQSLGHYVKKAPFKVKVWSVEGVYYVKRLVDVAPVADAETKPEPVKLPDPGRCPRCNGQLMRSREIDGMLVKCLACGFEPVEEVPPDIVRVPGSRGPRHVGARL